MRILACLMKTYKLAFLAAFIPILVYSQTRGNRKDFYSHDVGLWLGASYYIGDLNPKLHFRFSQPAGGVFYRFNQNYRLSYRVGFNYGSIMADDAQTDNADQLERNLNFKTRILELQAQAEFNFWEYRIGHNKYVFSPYIFLGIAGFHFDPFGNLNGNWVKLRPLATEGQRTSQNPNQRIYRRYQLSIPFGLGVKLDVAKSVGIGLFWGPRKTFTDYLDDVSGKYVNPLILASEKGAQAGAMADRSINAEGRLTNTGKNRGNPYNKDWYFFYGLTISIKLKQSPKECKGTF